MVLKILIFKNRDAKKKIGMHIGANGRMKRSEKKKKEKKESNQKEDRKVRSKIVVKVMDPIISVSI